MLAIERLGEVDERLMGVADELVKPPFKATVVVVVAPRPVTVARVSASEVMALDVMVMVEPDCETEVAPEAAMVSDPARLLMAVTTVVVSREIVGV